MSDQDFPISVKRVLATLIKVFSAKDRPETANILESAKSARIKQTDYDSFDGGRFLYSLFLEIPVELFVAIEPELNSVEDEIQAALEPINRKNSGDNQVLSRVVITHEIDNEDLPVDLKESDTLRIWEDRKFRIFISHVSSIKKYAVDLKHALEVFGISAFVAHEDINPTAKWQAEIEKALQSMHAICPILTEDFHKSSWTDQEVGFALSRGTTVVPVKIDIDPYGFMGKYQATPGNLSISAILLARNIIDIAINNPATSPFMTDALVDALKQSGSFQHSKDIMSKLERVRNFSEHQLKEIQDSLKNGQVSDSFGVPERINRLLKSYNYESTETKELKIDDLPF